MITLDELPSQQYEDWQEGDEYHILIIYTNSWGDRLSYDGNIIVTGISDSNPAGDFSNYSISMKRNGAWTKLKTYDNILVDGFGDPILDGEGNLIRV